MLLKEERWPWLCAAAAAAAFVFSLPGKLFWDSEVLVLGNQYLRDFAYLPRLWTTSVMAGGGVASNFYRPVATTVLMLGWHAWGAHPFGYHLLNLALHAVNAALVYLVALRVAGDKKVALLTALLFAIHPVQSEQVNYVDHVEGLLAAAFGLGSLLAYLRGASSAAIAALYALAMLSKEEGVVFGPLLGLLWLARPKEERDVKPLVPAALAAVVYLGLRATALNFLPNGGLGAQETAYAPLAGRVLAFPKALLGYLRLLVLPAGLHFDRALPRPGSASDPKTWAALAGSAAILAALARVSGRVGRLGVAWALLAFLPLWGLLPYNGGFAEHFLYVPCVGLFMAAAPLLLRVPLPALAALAVVFFGGDVRRSLEWQSPEKIYQTTLAHNPASFRAATNLGVEYFRRGDFRSAEAQYLRALELKPDYAVAHNNLGALFEAQGQIGGAIDHYKEAVRLDPNYLLARTNLAALLIDRGRPDEAIETLNAALAQDRYNDKAWKLLGVAYYRQGNLPQARAALQRGWELQPDELTYKRLASLEKAAGGGRP